MATRTVIVAVTLLIMKGEYDKDNSNNRVSKTNRKQQIITV